MDIRADWPVRRGRPQLIFSEKGSAVALVAVALVSLLCLTGLVIDGGMLFVAKSHLQKAANAAALSGAQELTHSEAAVREVAEQVVASHGASEHLVEIEVAMADKVRVYMEETIPLSFAGLFGLDAVPVRVDAVAEIGLMGSAMGAAPLGIDDSIPLEYNQEYSLKVDQTESDTGYFGILALGGTGSQTYEQNLKYGYDAEIKVGDVLPTQTGNVAGKTKDGVQERLSNCPYLPGETHHRDCSRIILVPVYRPYDYDQNQLKAVQVTGFAYFYITAPMDQNDKSITGMFIERTGTGFVDETAAERGAFAIRLID